MRSILITITLSFASLIITGQDVVVDGKIGVGTSTPATSLHVRESDEAIRIDGSNSYLSFYNDATFYSYIQHADPNLWLVNQQNGNIFFRTNDITRMTIDPAGNVGIGTSIPATAKLKVLSSILTAIMGQSESGVGIIGDSNNSDEFDFLASTLDGSNGYGESSSIRWKTDIRNIDDPIIKLNQLRGVYFNWKEEYGGNQALGFIAEEVGKVLPEIVVYEDNGIHAVGMDYSKMTPLLVEAANAMRREYQGKFDDQQSEIDVLRQEMTELRMLLKAQVAQGAGEE